MEKKKKIPSKYYATHDHQTNFFPPPPFFQKKNANPFSRRRQARFRNEKPSKLVNGHFFQRNNFEMIKPFPEETLDTEISP